MKNSHRYVRMHKAISSWQQFIAGDDPDNMSRWDVEQMLIPVSNANGKITYLKVSPGFLDVSETAQNPLNKISPLIKAPLEAWSGTNFFSGRSIHTGPFGQFSQSMIGDFGELGNALSGRDYDKTKLGLVGQKALGLFNAGKSIVNGEPTAASIAPSIFRETDVDETKASNIRQRVRESRAYIRQLQSNGQKPDENMLPRRRRRTRIQGLPRSGSGWKI